MAIKKRTTIEAASEEKETVKTPLKDKRSGRKQISERTPSKLVGLPSYTLDEAFSFVMGVKRSSNLKPKTLKGYEQNTRYFIEWATEKYGELSIHDVTPFMIREYILWCANDKQYYEGHPYKSDFDKDRKGLSPSSVNVRIRVLKTFFATLHSEEIISRNPMDNVALMRQDIDTVEPLSEDEIKRFLRAPDQRYFAQWRDYIIIVLILDTGMRLNEICSLEKVDIDFVKKQIKLPAAKNKNRKSRMLPLSTESARLLKQLISESEQHFDSPYVFITNSGLQLNEKTVQKSFSEYAEKAKLGRNVSPHVLRHNFATMAALNGMDVFTLMKILGHSDISTTRKYVQISTENLADQHAQFSPLQRILKRK